MFIRALHPRTLLLLEGEGGGGGTETPSGGEPSGTGTARTFTQDEVNALLAKEKGKIAGKYGDYDALKTKASKLDEIEAANQTALEKANGEASKLAGERDSIKGERDTLATRLARFEAAAKAGLDIKHAGRIQGSTPEEMESDAKALVKEFGAAASGPTFDGGPRGGNGGKAESMDQLIRRMSGRGPART